MIVSLFGILLLSQVAANEPPKPPSITLQLQVPTASLVSHDPLVVRVVMENVGKSPVVLQRGFSAGMGSVGFERRYAGFPWHAIYTENAGLNCSESLVPDKLAPATSIATYEVLFCKKGKPLFASAGKQELRAVVGIGAHRYESDPVAIEVIEIPKEKEKAIDDATRLLSQILTSEWVVKTASCDELARWEAALGESELKRAFGFTRATVAFWQAKDPERRRSTLADLDRTRAKLSSIHNGLLALILCEHYVKEKQWNSALNELSVIKIRTSKGDTLRSYAEYWKHMASARKAKDGDLKIELLPAAKHLLVGEPLLLKVRTINIAAVPVKLPSHIAREFGTLHLELRGPGDAEYQRLAFPALIGPQTPFASDVTLASKGAVTSCETVFKTGGMELAFPVPGQYRLRALASDSGEKLGDSLPLEITVSARKEGRREVDAATQSLVEHGLAPTESSVRIEPQVYESAAAKLEPSQLKTTLLWMAAAARLRDATESDKRELAQEDFDLLRSETDPVTRDHMTLTLVQFLIRANLLDAANFELQRKITDNNAQRVTWHNIIQERQQNEKATKAVPKTPNK